MTEQAKEPMKNKYIFPDILGKAMAKVSMRAQLESAMLSQALLAIGMILMGIYLVIYGEHTWFFKATLILNLICGFVLMSSYLVTTFQQYQNHMDVMGLDADAERKAIKAKGNIFKRIKLALAERKKKKEEAEKKIIEEEKIKDNERRILEL
jgi:hypothetical protein